MDPSALYPRPPQQNGLLNDPASLIGLMGNIQQLQSRQAVGQAFQNALGPNGLDIGAAEQSIKNNPAAAYGAPEAAMSLLEARRRQQEIATNQFGLLSANQSAIANIVGPLASNPNLKVGDVQAVLPALSRMGVPAPLLNAWFSDLSPGNVRDKVATLSNIAMGAGATSQPETLVDPITGQPRRVAHGALTGAGGGIPTGLAPQASGDIDAYQKDQAVSAQKLANIRPLMQAYPLIKKLSDSNFGPGSDTGSAIKNGLVTYGLLDPDSKAADANAMRQEVVKKLSQNIIFSPGGARSNEGLIAAMKSNPNEFLSKKANLQLLRDQIGMEMQDAAAPRFAGGATGYQNYRSQHYSNTDPAGFVLPLMDKDERTALKNSPNAQRIHATAERAIRAGMIPQPTRGVFPVEQGQ